MRGGGGDSRAAVLTWGTTAGAAAGASVEGGAAAGAGAGAAGLMGALTLGGLPMLCRRKRWRDWERGEEKVLDLHRATTTTTREEEGNVNRVSHCVCVVCCVGLSPRTPR